MVVLPLHGMNCEIRAIVHILLYSCPTSSEFGDRSQATRYTLVAGSTMAADLALTARLVCSALTFASPSRTLGVSFEYPVAEQHVEEMGLGSGHNYEFLSNMHLSGASASQNPWFSVL